MQVSQDRILTTHVGSLPRSQAVVDVVFGREEDTETDPARGDEIIRAAVEEIVRRQSDAGVDAVSDGELSKISYATYIKDRLTGFGGESHREPAQDLLDFPGVLRRRHEAGTRSEASPPRCIGEVGVKDMQPLETDLANLRRAVDLIRPVDAFMNSAAPGVIALFQPNDFYPSHEKYVEALGEAMRPEYEGLSMPGSCCKLIRPISAWVAIRYSATKVMTNTCGWLTCISRS